MTTTSLRLAWETPTWWWRPSMAPLPLLRDLRVHTVAFVTNRRPSAAVRLAASFNPGVRVLVLAPRSQKDRVEQLGATWADFNQHANHTAAFEVGFKQGSPGSRHYHTFCHVRWLALASALREQPLPADGAVAILDDDVLLFERLGERLQEAAAFHPTANAETVLSGAFVLTSAGALERMAAFLCALYALPSDDLGAVAWRYGEPKPLASLAERDRKRIHPAFRRGGQFARFSDMDAIEAFRLLSRSGELPLGLRARWAAGHRRSSCIHAPKVEKLGILDAAWRANTSFSLTGQPDVDDSTRHASEPHLSWHGSIPRLEPAGKPLCFLHLQGPHAKRTLLTPMLAAAGVGA